MSTTTILLMVGGTLLTLASFLKDYSKVSAIWAAYAGVCVVLSSGALFLQQKVRAAEVALLPWFSEALEKMQVSLGASNISFSMDYRELKKRRTPFAPWTFGEYKPIQLSVINDRLQIDTMIHDRHGNKAIRNEEEQIGNTPTRMGNQLRQRRAGSSRWRAQSGVSAFFHHGKSTAHQGILP